MDWKLSRDYPKGPPESEAIPAAPDAVEALILKAQEQYSLAVDNIGYEGPRRLDMMWMAVSSEEYANAVGQFRFRVMAQSAQAEQNYMRAIYHVTHKEAGAVAAEYQKQLPQMRERLAVHYAYCDLLGQKKDITEKALLPLIDKYKSFLEGTLSAYLFNMMKHYKAIPEDAKFSAIVPDQAKATTTSPMR